MIEKLTPKWTFREVPRRQKMVEKMSLECSSQGPRREVQKPDHCKKQAFCSHFQYPRGVGESIWESKKALKFVSKIGVLGVENGGSGEAPGDRFSEAKKEVRGGAH